jgi:protease I
MRWFVFVLLILLAGCASKPPTMSTNVEVNDMAKVLFVIAHDGFRDEECFDTKEVLKDQEVIIASTEISPATGSLGGQITPDITIDDALNRIDEFDAVVFVGGPGANVYFDNPTAHKIAQSAKNVLAAICIAPVTLAKAGVLKGKRATVWDDGQGTQAKILKENGATYVAEDVVVDDNLITANGPKAATKFGEAILKKLS